MWMISRGVLVFLDFDSSLFPLDWLFWSHSFIGLWLANHYIWNTGLHVKILEYIEYLDEIYNLYDTLSDNNYTIYIELPVCRYVLRADTIMKYKLPW